MKIPISTTVWLRSRRLKSSLQVVLQHPSRAIIYDQIESSDLTMSETSDNNPAIDTSEMHQTSSGTHLQLPSPIITKRNRTASTSEKAFELPETYGVIKDFCRERGHGFVTSRESGTDYFLHISDIEGEYIPLRGDEVKFRLCPIPPKFEKYQAVHVQIVNLTPEHHSKWDSQD